MKLEFENLSLKKLFVLKSFLNDEEVKAILNKNSVDVRDFAKDCLLMLIDDLSKNMSKKELDFSKFSHNELFILLKKLKEHILKFLYDENMYNYELSTYIGGFFDNLTQLIIINAQHCVNNTNYNKELFINSSKLIAMGDVVSMIAHQWRQPLQTILIIVQKLSFMKMTDGEISDEQIDKTIDNVKEQLDYLTETIDDFRGFLNPKNRQKRVCISDVLKKSARFLNALLKINNINLEIEVIKDYELRISENNLIQVLLNLIKNSKDAFEEKDFDDRVINIRCDFNESYVIIEFEDNAGGIPEKNLDKIFDPYFTTKNEDKGTGLGLYMSKTIIEDSFNGKLTVHNSSKGALFKILLPI